MTLTAPGTDADRLELCDAERCRNETDRGTCSRCRVEPKTAPPTQAKRGDMTSKKPDGVPTEPPKKVARG
jgi:hypothetical protein